jgi:hypothetical protein
MRSHSLCGLREGFFYFDFLCVNVREDARWFLLVSISSNGFRADDLLVSPIDAAETQILSQFIGECRPNMNCMLSRSRTAQPRICDDRGSRLESSPPLSRSFNRQETE